jgi:hypothetical protein
MPTLDCAAFRSRPLAAPDEFSPGLDHIESYTGNQNAAHGGRSPKSGGGGCSDGLAPRVSEGLTQAREPVGISAVIAGAADPLPEPEGPASASSYRPDSGRWSHYCSASLSAQHDAFVWFDTTSAVTPLPVRRAGQRGKLGRCLSIRVVASQ